MSRAEYILCPRSGGWTTQPGSGIGRLIRFDLTAERRGAPLGGHNVQVVVGAPDLARRGLDQQVVLTLESGWWVSLRNQFADAPSAAAEILESVSDELSEITAGANTALGQALDEVSQRLFASVFRGVGPDYWGYPQAAGLIEARQRGWLYGADELDRYATKPRSVGSMETNPNVASSSRIACVGSTPRTSMIETGGSWLYPPW